MSAQWFQDEYRKVDTLSIIDRLSFNTNSTDWLLMVPNLGIEYDVANNKNWNQWSVGLNLRYKWGTGNTYVPGFVYNVFEIKAEGRNYWRTRKIDNYIKRHKSILDKAWSKRRTEPRHPVTTFYRGIYVSYAIYSFRLSNGKYSGRQGRAIMAGLLYGIERPLYRYKNGSSIDMDLGISVGIGITKHYAFQRDPINNIYVKGGGQKHWTIMPFPVINELRAGIVYRPGKTMGYTKYNHRYDVDIVYKDSIINAWNERAAAAFEKARADSTFKSILAYYNQRLDSIIEKNSHSTISRKGVTNKKKISNSKANKKITTTTSQNIQKKNKVSGISQKRKEVGNV